MAISKELKYAKLDELYLDAKNPRLGRHDSEGDLSQKDILGLMRSWVLDELAESYLESGFWTHEALLVVEEELEEKLRLVVIEGNRRLAALKYLRDAYHEEEVPRKWQTLIQDTQATEEHFNKLFNEIPYIQVDSREEVESFLGFRHVTGIKQWRTEQKAQYIAKLIEQGTSYEEVMRKIGSRTSTVRQHYISYQLLLQMEDSVENFSFKDASGRFSVMYLTLSKKGVQNYLQIDIMAGPETAKKPVPEDHLQNLANFALWLFGNDERPPLFEDSRDAQYFNTALEDPKAVQYLENSKQPNLNHAFQLAGGSELETARLIYDAANSIALSLSHVHHHKDSQEIQRAVEKLSIDFKELLNRFPKLEGKFFKED